MAGLYLHIPFCRSRCAYCDFYSTLNIDRVPRYVDALVHEAEIRGGELSEPITTLYVGGGTPSLLSPELWRRLVAGLRQAMDLSQVMEFTVEVNPDDVDDTLIATLLEVGCNRVSMGVQSFVDSELQAVNRRHTAQQAIEAVALLQRAAIENISIDLIYGLPCQTPDSWQYSLDVAVGLGVAHISAYNLTYEKNTPLWHRREQGIVIEASDELCITFYNQLVGSLQRAGYEHYEISNFAKPGRRSRHNSSYWVNKPYLGLGAAAHSYDGQTRSYNPSSLDNYLTAIEAGVSCACREVLTDDERFNETVMVRLRTCEGIDLDDLALRFGNESRDNLLVSARPHLAVGRLLCDNKSLRLSATGVMVSDSIIVDLMV